MKNAQMVLPGDLSAPAAILINKMICMFCGKFYFCTELQRKKFCKGCFRSGAEENIWTYEGCSNRRPEKTA
jgi:hypothetical protein